MHIEAWSYVGVLAVDGVLHIADIHPGDFQLKKGGAFRLTPDRLKLKKPFTIGSKTIGNNVFDCKSPTNIWVKDNRNSLSVFDWRLSGMHTVENVFALSTNEPRREKTGFLHRRKQRRRSASR